MKKVLSFLAMALALVLLTINPVSAFSTGVLDAPDFKIDSDGFVYIEKETRNNNLKQKIFYGEYLIACLCFEGFFIYIVNRRLRKHGN